MIVLKPKVILRHVQEGEEIFWIKSDLTSLEGGAESKDTATTLVRWGLFTVDSLFLASTSFSGLLALYQIMRI